MTGAAEKRGPVGKRDRTRARLIEAAAAIAEEKGFVATSLDEIAGRAGVTKGSIYSNFRSKTELVMAVADARALRLRPAYVPGGQLEDQLRAVAEAVTELLPLAAGRGRLAAAFQTYAATDPVLSAHQAGLYEAAFGRWAAALSREYGATLAVDPRALVVAVQALAAGFVHQHMLTPNSVTRDVVLEAFLALARGAQRSGA